MRSALTPIASAEPPSTDTVYPEGSGESPLVDVVISSDPVPAAQAISKTTSTSPPEGTVTSRGLSPATVQLAATSLRTTDVAPAATFPTCAVALAPIGWPSPPPTLKA